MAVTKEQFQFGAWVAGASAVVALLTAVVTLYTQTATAIDGVVREAVRRDFAPVGTVVSSTLPPIDFAEATGEIEGDSNEKRTWILADGRDVKGTAYAKLINVQVIPDLRGMFLRGIDGAGTRRAGELQGFATALPTTAFVGQTSEAGPHVHGGGMGDSGVGDRFNAGGRDYLVPVHMETAAAGVHSHTVTVAGGGDEETRPVNVAVYYYIKIN